MNSCLSIIETKKGLVNPEKNPKKNRLKTEHGRNGVVRRLLHSARTKGQQLDGGLHEGSRSAAGDPAVAPVDGVHRLPRVAVLVGPEDECPDVLPGRLADSHGRLGDALERVRGVDHVVGLGGLVDEVGEVVVDVVAVEEVEAVVCLILVGHRVAAEIRGDLVGHGLVHLAVAIDIDLPEAVRTHPELPTNESEAPNHVSSLLSLLLEQNKLELKNKMPEQYLRYCFRVAPAGVAPAICRLSQALLLGEFSDRQCR